MFRVLICLSLLLSSSSLFANEFISYLGRYSVVQSICKKNGIEYTENCSLEKVFLSRTYNGDLRISRFSCADFDCEHSYTTMREGIYSRFSNPTYDFARWKRYEKKSKIWTENMMMFDGEIYYKKTFWKKNEGKKPDFWVRIYKLVKE